jgi:hypothetical protein
VANGDPVPSLGLPSGRRYRWSGSKTRLWRLGSTSGYDASEIATNRVDKWSGVEEGEVGMDLRGVSTKSDCH